MEIEKFVRVHVEVFSLSIYKIETFLALVLWYSKNISGPVLIKKNYIYWVIGSRIVPKSGDRKTCEVACLSFAFFEDTSFKLAMLMY